MHFVRYLFFENPLTLWVLLGLAEACLLIAWRRRPSRRLVIALVALPAAGGLLGVLDAAVETDYERIHRTLRAMKHAVATGDAETFLERVSPDYRNGPFGKADLAAAVRRGLENVRAKASSPHIRLQPHEAVVTQVYEFRAAPGSRIAIHPNLRRVKWEGVFAPDADGEWRLRRATALQPRRITPEEAVRYLSNY